ncbi:hypothetical protein Lal_00004409 [Lupinus albus]|uniref:Uncharacterized protein n=1 Tax=Lupinus albus TaxID=3870 RepID=A0A6A5M222_LUPAL|nr:hypothetical protein Lalb_Chr23g0266151 [Lupinus albus]KAF1865035.1 hypothetical protein Lal_00004409 [Lupinus albus]
MKQCTTLTPSENEVVQILLDFRNITLSNLESGFIFPLTWGRKRLRSAISDTPSSSSSPPPPRKAEASSPATPLSFSPSESEDKPTLLRKNVSLKRKKDHYLKTIEEFTKDNGLLHVEVMNVKCHFEKLKGFNLKLKARKQELTLPKQPYQLEIPTMVHPSPLILNQPQIGDTTENITIDQFNVLQKTKSFGIRSSSSSNGLGNSNNIMGPIGIPDLNLLPIDEPIMGVECGNVSVSDKNLSRVIEAAQARQKRIQICKFKNPITNSKVRYSWR